MTRCQRCHRILDTEEFVEGVLPELCKDCYRKLMEEISKQEWEGLR